MNKNKHNSKNDIIEDDDTNNIEDDDLSYSSPEQGERNMDKPTMDRLFDIKSQLKSIEKQFKGYVEKDGKWVKVSTELARDSFIDNHVINGLKAIMTEHVIYSYLSEEDAETILREENLKFIKSCVNEPSITNQNDLRLMVEIYDHALQTFMGLPTKGHGSVVLRDVSGGLSQGNTHLDKQKKEGFFSDLSNMFSFNKNAGEQK